MFERVTAAREIQRKRYEGTGVSCNAKLQSAMSSEACRLTEKGEATLKKAFESQEAK